MEKVYNIGVEATMEVIGGKWKPIILCNLRHQVARPSELRRAIPAISQKMLTQQLRELEADGIVDRHVYQQVPSIAQPDFEFDVPVGRGQHRPTPGPRGNN